MVRVIDGTKFAHERFIRLKAAIASHTQASSPRLPHPCLSILSSGWSEDKFRFLGKKMEAADAIGVQCNLIEIPQTASIDFFRNSLMKEVLSDKNNGVIIQVILPIHSVKGREESASFTWKILGASWAHSGDFGPSSPWKRRGQSFFGSHSKSSNRPNQFLPECLSGHSGSLQGIPLDISRQKSRHFQPRPSRGSSNEPHRPLLWSGQCSKLRKGREIQNKRHPNSKGLLCKHFKMTCNSLLLC